MGRWGDSRWMDTAVTLTEVTLKAGKIRSISLIQCGVEGSAYVQGWGYSSSVDPKALVIRATTDGSVARLTTDGHSGDEDNGRTRRGCLVLRAQSS